MTAAAAPALPALNYGRLRIPMAAFEVLAYLSIVAAASLAFLAGWLTVNGCVVLTVLLLASLIVLSWIHLGQGRHPVFLFLCTLMFFQGGRLLAYCLGGTANPMAVQLMQSSPFSIGRTNEGIVLLCLSLSALCVYAPGRVRYSGTAVPDLSAIRQYLPYLYLLFFATLPVQLYKNYRYLQWARQHGGYSSIYLSHASLAASVPFLVRVIPLISFPVFVAIFVFESRKRNAYWMAVLYFGAASLILLLGARGAVFGLLLSLWYVTRVKSIGRPLVVRSLAFVLALVLVADVVRNLREDSATNSGYSFLPAEFLELQGVSIDVTSTVVANRSYFAPYAWSYPLQELPNAFIAIDTEHYRRGKGLAYDVPVFLNVIAFENGAGTGGSYLAEAYAIGGLFGLVVISLMIGLGLHGLHQLSRYAFGLLAVAMTLPDILLMPRGALADWFSVLLKNLISFASLWIGWKFYRLLTSFKSPHREAGYEAAI